MLAFLGCVLRVIIGFVAASFAAGAVQVLFALTPSELANAEVGYWLDGGVLLLGTTTITALFSAPFVFLSAVFSELRGIRSFAYHGLIGIAIALVGHALLYSGQTVDEPSIVNSYAAAAYLTAGLVGGFAYWLFAGRFAHRSGRPEAEKWDDEAKSPLTTKSPSRSEDTRTTSRRSTSASVPVTKPVPAATAATGSKPSPA